MSTTEPLNTAPIQTYLQQVKSADLSNAKEIKLPIAQAKVLAYTLGIVMSRLNGDLEQTKWRSRTITCTKEQWCR